MSGQQHPRQGVDLSTHSDSSRPARLSSADILRRTAIIAGFFIALLLVWVARDIVLTAFIGTLFGLAVASASGRLTQWRVPRGLGAALVVFGFVGLLYGIGAWIAPTLATQGALLRTKVPEAVDRVDAWVNARPGLAGIVLGGRGVTQERATAQDTTTARSDARAAVNAAADTGSASGGGKTAVPSLRQRIGQELSGASRYFFPFLSSTVTVAAGLFIILVLSIYIGGDPDLYRAGIMHLIPHQSRERGAAILTRVAAVLRRWLVTQLIAMIVIGLASTIALLILQVKAAMALGVIAGLLEFIPTIGPILASIPAIAMGFLDSPEKALYVGIAYLIIQQAEGHILIPMLMKEGMDLPPALTIISQAVMALLFGFLGLLVAVPVLAAIIAVIKMMYVEQVIGDDVTDVSS